MKTLLAEEFILFMFGLIAKETAEWFNLRVMTLRSIKPVQESDMMLLLLFHESDWKQFFIFISNNAYADGRVEFLKLWDVVDGDREVNPLKI